MFCRGKIIANVLCSSTVQVKSVNTCTVKVFCEKQETLLSKLRCREHSSKHGLVIRYLITCGFNAASILTENKSLFVGPLSSVF